jgi:hypothetical protein
MVDEQMIRAAYDAIAGTASGPERVRARIEARTRVHRQRRMLLVGAGALGTAAAATAVGVPLAIRDRPRVQGPAPGGLSSSAPVPEPVEVPLLFAPRWLPDGIAEQFRNVKIVTAGGADKPAGGTRNWLLPGVRYANDGTGLEGVMFSVGERIDDNSGQPIRVGAVTGTLRVTDSSYVEWQPPGAPNLLVSVYGLPNATETALRIARSVARTAATTAVSMRSPWVPDRFAGFTLASAYPTADGWCQSLTHTSTNHRENCTIFARTGRAPQGSAYQVRRPDGVTLYILADPPGIISNATPLSREEATRMLAEVVCIAPDLSWAGGR